MSERRGGPPGPRWSAVPSAEAGAPSATSRALDLAVAAWAGAKAAAVVGALGWLLASSLVAGALSWVLVALLAGGAGLVAGPLGRAVRRPAVGAAVAVLVHGLAFGAAAWAWQRPAGDTACLLAVGLLSGLAVGASGVALRRARR